MRARGGGGEERAKRAKRAKRASYAKSELWEQYGMKHAVWRPAMEPTLGCCCGVYAPMWSRIGPSFCLLESLHWGARCGMVWHGVDLCCPRAALLEVLKLREAS